MSTVGGMLGKDSLRSGKGLIILQVLLSQAFLSDANTAVQSNALNLSNLAVQARSLGSLGSLGS